jgi:hypothetical protein
MYTASRVPLWEKFIIFIVCLYFLSFPSLTSSSIDLFSINTCIGLALSPVNILRQRSHDSNFAGCNVATPQHYFEEEGFSLDAFCRLQFLGQYGLNRFLSLFTFTFHLSCVLHTDSPTKRARWLSRHYTVH